MYIIIIYIIFYIKKFREIFQIISLIAKISSYIEIVFYLNSKLTIVKKLKISNT